MAILPGGTGPDECYSVVQANDGGYVAVGATSSNDLEVNGNHGGVHDLWVVKIDSAGAFEWQRCLGGTDQEKASDIEKTIDGGYIISGFSESNDGDVSGNHSSYADIWLTKLDSFGNLEWQKCIGGFIDDYGQSIIQADDTGYLMDGYTFSNDGDVSGNHGQIDLWAVKLTPTGLSIQERPNEQIEITAYTNADCSILLRFFSNENGMAKISVTDLLGRCIVWQDVDVLNGFDTIRLCTDQFNGIYNASLTGEIGSGTCRVFGF